MWIVINEYYVVIVIFIKENLDIKDLLCIFCLKMLIIMNNFYLFIYLLGKMVCLLIKI